MTMQVFFARRFIPTQHSTADDKARFCNSFARFVLGGFVRSVFKAQLYRRLCNIFGHIAHYDETGFYEVWFATPDKQRQFIQNIHNWIQVGQPQFCWVDVERELKAWAAMEAEAIETVIAENERKYAEASEAETDRRAALQSKTRQQFTVAARSSNTNAFGQRQYVMVADDGSAFKVQRSYQYPWQLGQVVKVPLRMGDPDWSALQCECPERIENCPVEVWGGT